MKTTKPTKGRSADHEPRHTACASSSPAMPTYMGFRLIALAPSVTSTDARSGWNGSKVVPLARNRLAADPAIEKDTSEMATAPTVRLLVGGRVPPGSARWVKAATTAAAGGGMRGTVSTLRSRDGFVEKPKSTTAP